MQSWLAFAIGAIVGVLLVTGYFGAVVQYARRRR